MERTSNSENAFIRPRGSASKNPAVSALQDLLFYQLIGLGFLAKNIIDFKQSVPEVDEKISRLLYLTNKGINFNILALIEAIQTTYKLKMKLENMYKILLKLNNKRNNKIPLPVKFQPSETLSQLVSQANVVNVQKNIRISNIKIISIKEIIRESLTCSVNYIAQLQGQFKIQSYIFYQLYEILDFLCKENPKEDECRKYALKSGELQTELLGLFFSFFEKKYGIIKNRMVSTSLKKGYAILVAGDDFVFLTKLLQEVENKDIRVYTYGNLNYAHAFPEIFKYSALAGIYRSKYNNFAADIESFSGVVVLTSGNLEELTDIYRGRVFSTEDISLLGVSKLDKDNLKPLINSAYDADGFEKDFYNEPIYIGFGGNEIDKYSKKYVDLLLQDKLKTINIVFGCNDLFNKANKLIKNKKGNLVIKIACDMPISLNKSNVFVLDLGQFVNLYNLMRLLFSISGQIKKDINDLPLKIIINLHNSETISGLLMLLSLGYKNIQIDSDLPNYITENLIRIFQKDFNLKNLNQEDIFDIRNKNKLA